MLESSAVIQRAGATTVNVQCFSHITRIHQHRHPIDGAVRSSGEMRAIAEWAEEQWDVLATVAALALALALSGALSVAYNVVAVTLDRSTMPAAIEAVADRPATTQPLSSPLLAPSS
jgi:hypothetical protein